MEASHRMSLVPFIDHALGLHVEVQDLAISQVVLRALVMTAAALVMARLVDRHVFARKNVFDIMLALILASMLSRAINGSAAYFGSIVAGFAMILLHRVIGWVACRWPRLSRIIKGRDEILIENGEVSAAALLRNDLSLEDIQEDVRLRASTDDLARVQTARIERSGDISVILRAKPGSDQTK